MAASTGPMIAKTIGESVPRQPERPRPAGSPNVVVVLLDDLGFAQLSSFGSDIATPHMDRLGDEGLRYNRFHVTALCSPSRAALLTGRNHRQRLEPGRHRVGFRFVPDEGGGGIGALLVDEVVVGAGALPGGMGTSGMQIGGGGLHLGEDTGFPVSDAAPSPLQLRAELE